MKLSPCIAQNPKMKSPLSTPIHQAKIPPSSCCTVSQERPEDMWVTKLRQIEKGSKLARERGLTSRHF